MIEINRIWRPFLSKQSPSIHCYSGRLNCFHSLLKISKTMQCMVEQIVLLFLKARQIEYQTIRILKYVPILLLLKFRNLILKLTN